MPNKTIQKLSLGTLISASQKEVVSQFTLLERFLKEFHIEDETTQQIVDLVDPKRRADYEDLIRVEKDKVINLQLTLAFVGTMKAGKSMTINAITGARLLPSRDSAMTALPTVVTHKPQQKEPLLRLSHPTPFNNAIKRIREKVNNNETQSPVNIHPDQATTLNKIQNNKFTIKREYVGESQIYDILVCLNDIVRLAVGHFGLPSPLESYKDIEQFPHIEIEFSYLKDRTSSYGGTLSLVDTPGPNEAGTELKDLVRNQLKRASTVISLLDYTSLGSVADDQMRKDISEIQEIVGSKLFVLLNKFDQKTEIGGLSREKAIEVVCTQLFPDKQLNDEETLSVRGKVFPVSAKKAFYANFGKRAISIQGRLPESTGNDWVMDFARLAFGTLANDLIVDPKFHKQGSDNLWNESELAAPLEEIIVYSLDQSVPMILEAALSKLRSITRDLLEELELIEKSHAKGFNELQEVIAKMKKRLDKIEGRRLEVETNKAKILDALGRRIKEHLKKWQEERPQGLADLEVSLTKRIRNPNEEDPLDKIENLLEEASEKSKRGKKWGRVLLWVTGQSILELAKAHGGMRVALSMALLDRPRDWSTIKFKTKKEALDFTEEIRYMIRKFIEPDLQAHLNHLNGVVGSAQDSLSKTLETQVLPLVEEEREELKEMFDLSIKIPLPKFEGIKLDMATIMSETMKPDQVEHYTYKRSWRTLWIWKREEVIYKTDDEHYVFEKSKFEESMNKAIDKFRANVEKEVNNFISSIFTGHLEKFFAIVNSAFDRVQENIRTGIDIQHQTSSFQHIIIEKIAEVFRELRELAARTKDTEKGLNDYFKSPQAHQQFGVGQGK